MIREGSGNNQGRLLEGPGKVQERFMKGFY